jgi:hypothetical protein
MKFRTVIQGPDLYPKVQYGDELMLLGSCFAAEMAKRLTERKMLAHNNPIGILYNPMSILNVFELLNAQFEISDESLIRHNGIWHSFLHHSQFSHPDKQVLKDRISTAHEATLNGLLKAKWLILTFGTAFIYRNIEREMVVGNCHKLPSKSFKRERIPLMECMQAVEKTIQIARSINPNLSVLCSVSPIRHQRDGLIENQRSKATLLLAVDQICDRMESVHYFPSYEIMMDDLRDYRFYAKDLIHPSEVAVDYIWHLFSNAIIDDEAKKRLARIEKINQARQHRHIHAQSPEIQVFANKHLEKIVALQNELPMISFEEDELYFRSLLHSFEEKKGN